MRKLALLIVCCCATPAQAALLLYEGFKPNAVQTGPFNYAPGEPLAASPDPIGGNPLTPNGQFNAGSPATDKYWRYAAAAPAAAVAIPGIASGSLNYPGLIAPTGNSVVFDTSKIGSARAAFASQNSGTVYWSGLLRVNSIGTLNAVNGMLIGGYNNGTGPTTLPGTVEAVLRIRKDAALNQYYVGVGRNSGTAAGNIQFDTTPHFAGDTVFVVGAYEFVAGTLNDKAHMWINPSAATFANNALIPLATLTSNPGLADVPLGALVSFNLRNVNTVGNQTLQFDELRIGTDWASVTPVPEPAAVWIFLAISALVMGRRLPGVNSLMRTMMPSE